MCIRDRPYTYRNDQYVKPNAPAAFQYRNISFKAFYCVAQMQYDPLILDMFLYDFGRSLVENAGQYPVCKVYDLYGLYLMRDSLRAF